MKPIEIATDGFAGQATVRAESPRPNVLVAYATKHGSTEEVGAAVAARLRQRDLLVEVCPAAAVDDVTRYSGVVLGGSVYFGRWHRGAVDFLARHATALATRPLAVFALGPKTLAAADVRETRKQLDAALAKAGASPARVAVFGGVIDPARLRFPLNRLPASDARDWSAIERWADCVAETLAPRGLTRTLEATKGGKR